MFDNKQYVLRTETADGDTHFYISFTDGQGNRHEVEVSHFVYQEFLRFVVIERSLRHWDERYREYSELTEETLLNRVLFPPKSLEDSVIDGVRNEHLRAAIQDLTATQQRRFVLYHDFDLTYEQIAQIEGCSYVAVKRTIDKAKRNISKKLLIFR